MARGVSKPRAAKGSRSRIEVPGRHIGTKRRDMRWEAPDGEIWDSRFEYEVYLGHKALGLSVRRTGEQDDLLYTHAIRNGSCPACGSSKVVSKHSFRPDLLVDSEVSPERRNGQLPTVPASGYYIEAKGFFRADRRSLLRSFRKARPDVDLRFVLQRDFRVTAKLTIVEWIRKFLKCPVGLWTGSSVIWL